MSHLHFSHAVKTQFQGQNVTVGWYQGFGGVPWRGAPDPFPRGCRTAPPPQLP